MVWLRAWLPLYVTYMPLYLFSLSRYLIALVTLDISHFNINLLSAPASLKQYFIKHVLTKSSHVFAVNTPTCICSPTSLEFHKQLPNTGNCAQPAVMIHTLLLHAQYVTRSHVLFFRGAHDASVRRYTPDSTNHRHFLYTFPFSWHRLCWSWRHERVSPRRISKCESQTEDVTGYDWRGCNL